MGCSQPDEAFGSLYMRPGPPEVARGPPVLRWGCPAPRLGLPPPLLQ